MCWLVPLFSTPTQLCALRAGPVCPEAVAMWYLLLNYSNGQIKLRVRAWSETGAGLKERLSLNTQEEEEARTGEQAALETEPGTLSRDMGAGEQGLQAPCWPHHCLPALTRRSSPASVSHL